MSAPSRLSAVSVAGAPPGWVAPTGRYSANGPVDPLSSVVFFGVDDWWNGTLGADSQGQQGGATGFRYLPRRDVSYFTPLVGRLASAFPAAEAAADGRVSTAAFLSDLKRVVALYEYSKKLTADSLGSQGSLVNRFS